MRSFSAAALFTIAIITGCLGAQSDRSRSRSGPIRSVPIAANVKRDVDFDCPEEFGYYPHPTDCTLYYVCVFGGALLESCTGGLMYSHELQTCDWPRNVGCDGTSAVGEELERVPEQRQRNPPPPPPPRRTPPPPPPRAQPKPVVTSRGQPKISRQEYEKQQQLYAEVDDLPPVEELESDRQQRVYRGQPSTIGQVQKDRDGYSIQQNSGRTLNSNIIPASIPQNSGKIGSFSFGSQVDERRTATVTPAPQSYSEDKSDALTDSLHDIYVIDIETNEITANDITEKTVLRRKREVIAKTLGANDTITQSKPELKKRSDSGEEIEYIELENDHEEGIPQDDTDRGKRQIRYYFKNGHKAPEKSWGFLKPTKVTDYSQLNYNSNEHNSKYNEQYKTPNNGHDGSHRPYYVNNSNFQTQADPFLSYQNSNIHSGTQLKSSLPSLTSLTFNQIPLNSASQIITKSPPISSLNNDQFTSLAGGFYNNVAKPNIQYLNQGSTSIPRNPLSYPDLNHVSSTVVTGKPVPLATTPRTQENYRNPEQIRNLRPTVRPTQQAVSKRPQQNKEYSSEEDDNEEGDESYEESEEDGEEDGRYVNDFKPPYEFRHPSNRFKEIENPFANPNFDFDSFLSNLSNGQYTSAKPNLTPKPTISAPIRVSTESSRHQNNFNSGFVSSTVNYDGMSTPKPFTIPSGPGSSIAPFLSSIRPAVGVGKQGPRYEQPLKRPELPRHVEFQQLQQSPIQVNVHETTGNIVRPKIKPPNFNDDRQLPISYTFNRPIINSTPRPYQDTEHKENSQKGVSGKPYIIITATNSPIISSTPKHKYVIKPEDIIQLKPVSSVQPYLVSSNRPHNVYVAVKQSTPKPLTTIANEQLSALQQYWNVNPTTETIPHRLFAIKSTTPANIQKLENLFAQIIKTTPTPTALTRNHSIYLHKNLVTTTAKPEAKRRPIPKPSPEMNDYYYDDDDYYYEPVVKPKYMPSTEVRPQRPPMAQNDKEYYDDSYEDDNQSISEKPQSSRINIKFNSYNPTSATKNQNDVPVVTKGPLKQFNKNNNEKIPIPVLVDFDHPKPNTIRPEVSKYQQHVHRNRTMFNRKPVTEKGPNTEKPPKYLNQTTLRPYTVRHRLAKPTTVKEPDSNQDKQTRGRMRHPNIVAQMKVTTPHDSHNQETRFTKLRHDDKTNSLEPTESIAPVSYSQSPRPKMLYNGSQNYSPDQYDPFYAVYDEDSELYKDTDYVQQYNTASIRPAVQQTYRGTPPPSRRPVETYTPRPSPDDYDDELIQPQINTQNQYQTPVRHSTRGEGNELGYEHNPSRVKTTLYEATTISTTPSTTSTSTTTQRSTTAPYTEAMTPSRYTPRSSTDENPIPESSPQPLDNTYSSVPAIPLPVINFSSLAKPFEKTDNSHRLRETIILTEKNLTSPKRFNDVTNQNNDEEVVRDNSNTNNKKRVSLTSGFSIRRNSNSTNNPYTLTVLTRPFDDYNRASQQNNPVDNRSNLHSDVYDNNDSSDSQAESDRPLVESQINVEQIASENVMRRKDFGPDISEDDEDIPVYVRPTSRSRPIYISRTRTTSITPTTSSKYYITTEQTVLKQPLQYPIYNRDIIDSTENAINTEVLIDTAMLNSPVDEFLNVQTNNTVSEPHATRGFSRVQYENELAVSPYKALDNLRNTYNIDTRQSYTTTPATTSTVTTSTTQHTTTTRVRSRQRNPNKQKHSRTKPSYYSYRLEDEIIPDQTTEIFNGKVKNVIRAFLNNFVSSSEPEFVQEYSTAPTTTPQKEDDRVINIGYQKKSLNNVNEKPLRSNINRLQIITEPNENKYVTSNIQSNSFIQDDEDVKDFLSTSTTMSILRSTSPRHKSTTPMSIQNSRNSFRNSPNRDSYESKFSSLITSNADIRSSKKYQQIIDDHTESNDQIISLNYEQINPTEEDIKITTESEILKPNNVDDDIASTTSTTKATTTVKIEPTTSTVKSMTFPTRASRVNPAIKLAATNPGGGRRSYQSSTKCSSDDSLQANPKCNEIKYQRPTSTRGRGPSHYSKGSSSDLQSQPAPNRGTPPTRSRPTLKPSTAIVSKSTEYSDIYAHPPSRPAPVYPQPTPDKTAAKCRKDVCLLPDCYCGGKDIPGELPIDQVPQIVLLTFDDSVNDLNKGLYTDLFEKGRVNPNGCPISATFYVSHEWTDYSQVQNLYSAGHEMASHTISHSFGEQFSQKKWYREVGGQRELLAAYGGVKLEDIRGMRAPFLSVGGNKMFKMLYDSNFTYDSSLPVYENKPPSWPYTLDYKLFHDCMIPPCPTKSYPGVWEVPMVMWQDLNGGRCSMGDACANPPEAENVYKMILKNFDRHYTSNRAPFGLFYHAAWFTQPHHKEGFIMFLDFINQMPDVWIVTNWQALQWVRDPTPINRLNNFQPFQCNYQDRPRKCNNPKVCNLWHKSGVRYMRTCQPCPEIYPWTGKSGIRSSRIDNDIGE